MAPRFPVYFLAPLALAAACAAPGGEPDRYWQKLAAEGSATDFDFDNARCGATASRMKPPARADQTPGGIVPPANRIDRPPRPWPSAVSEQAYMDCMSRAGWSVVSR